MREVQQGELFVVEVQIASSSEEGWLPETSERSSLQSRLSN